MSEHMKHLTLIHGLYSSLKSWPWRLRPHFEDVDGLTVHTPHYDAGFFAPWTHWVTNPRVADQAAGNLSEYVKEGAESIHHDIVAHSNGGSIAALMIQRAWEQYGIRTGTAVLIAGANHSDVEISDLAELISLGALGRVVAWCSPDDPVIRPSLEWVPGWWGALGRRGLRRNDKNIGLQVEGWQPITVEERGRSPWWATRWFPGFSHGDYFASEERAHFIETILSDIGMKSSAHQD